MANILSGLQFALGRILYPIRGHDARRFIHSPAFVKFPEPNMTLESLDCGMSGSSLLPHHTCLDEDTEGMFPNLHWSRPPQGIAEEYVLICEDLDLPIPYLVIHHGLFWNIPGTTTTASHEDVSHQKENVKAHVTDAGWKYIPNLRGTPYVGPAPPLGHGSHRYVFTIIALNKPLDFTSHEKVTKQMIKDAMVDRVLGWGQWTGTFQRPWPRC